jgi:hypothetical protein
MAFLSRANGRRPLAPKTKARAKSVGRSRSRPSALKTFAIALPDGAVKGKGFGEIQIDLVRGLPPAFRLTSNLVGLTLAIPEVGWKKSVDVAGSLLAEGTFGTPRQDRRIGSRRIKPHCEGLGDTQSRWQIRQGQPSSRSPSLTGSRAM